MSLHSIFYHILVQYSHGYCSLYALLINRFHHSAMELDSLWSLTSRRRPYISVCAQCHLVHRIVFHHRYFSRHSQAIFHRKFCELRAQRRYLNDDKSLQPNPPPRRENHYKKKFGIRIQKNYNTRTYV